MIAHVNTFGLSGIDGFFVDAEIDISKGLPDFNIIGMGNLAVREAADRIRAALGNTGFALPLGKVTVNLAPAGVRKEGTCYDLAIAVGILKCGGYIDASFDNFGFIGELSLDGFLRPVRGVLSMIREAAGAGIKKCVVPLENANEAALIEVCDIYPASSLTEAIQILKSKRTAWKNFTRSPAPSMNCGDFREVAGQEQAVRAAEIAAAGGHNILFLGAPGCGKTMIASRIPGIMPALTREESLEVMTVYSVLDLLPRNCGLIQEAPFRTAYPDITKAGLIGGGRYPVPGEISLAHKGVLFLDELAEFGRNVIQSLRQPIENGRIMISRCGDFVEFPADFLLVAASNPCKCGKMLEDLGKCTCTPSQAKQYLSRISKPILDRIDLHVPVRRIPLQSHICKYNEKTETIRNRVAAARAFQKFRYREEQICLNGKLAGAKVRKYCRIDRNCEALLQMAADQAGISMRGYEKILKTARTIADLELREQIAEGDIAEALQYRFLDSFDQEAA
ncbi:MAG: YifB family Mg chelatase-like AAA ATPase [Clostridia bacterium]